MGKRLFFSLIPEQGVRNQLTEVIRSFPIAKGAQPISSDRLHVTLLFLGNVDRNTFKWLEKKVVQIPIQSFTMQLDLYGYFKRSKVIWIGCSSCPSELNRLVNYLKSIVVQSEINFNHSFYEPHATLFKKVMLADFPSAPVLISWKVDTFYLVESVPHENTTRYNKVASYRLMDD